MRLFQKLRVKYSKKSRTPSFEKNKKIYIKKITQIETKNHKKNQKITKKYQKSQK